MPSVFAMLVNQIHQSSLIHSSKQVGDILTYLAFCPNWWRQTIAGRPLSPFHTFPYQYIPIYIYTHTHTRQNDTVEIIKTNLKLKLDAPFRMSHWVYHHPLDWGGLHLPPLYLATPSLLHFFSNPTPPPLPLPPSVNWIIRRICDRCLFFPDILIENYFFVKTGCSGSGIYPVLL